MSTATVNRLETESVGRLLVNLALPAIAAQFVNMLYSVVDRIYIGHIPDIGSAALTGVGIAFPIIMMIAAFSSLIGLGGAPLAAIKMGKGRFDEAEQILGNCFVALLGISIVLTAFFLTFGEELLLLFGAGPETLPYAKTFLNTYVCGTIFVQIVLGLTPFISTQGFAKTSMVAVMIGAIISTILAPIFIFIFGMGVQGAALANIIAQAISAAWVLRFLFAGGTKLRIQKKYMRIQKAVIIPVLLLGVSPFIMQSTESLLNIAFNSSLKNYGGDLGVGAMTILASIMQVLIMPILGLTQGAQPIISYNYGAKNNERVKKAFNFLFVISMGYSVVFWLLLMIFPSLFVSIFSSDPELVETTVWATRIYMGLVFVMGAQLACQQTFIALGQAKTSLFLALLRKIILLIPLIYILPQFFSNKTFAVFLAEPVSDFLAVAVTVTLFFIQFKKILARNTMVQAENVS